MHDIEIGLPGVPHTKAVVMPRDQRDVFHSRRFRKAHPSVGIEVNRIEELLEPCIILYGDVPVIHYPLAITGDAEWAPMDEQSKFGVAEPLARRFVEWRRRIGDCSGLGKNAASYHKRQQ